MSFTYDITPIAMFEDRFEQFVTLGIPRADVTAMRGTIANMWADAPGGWVYEWSKLAESYRAAGQPFLSSLAFGCAKFPCLANEARRAALVRQVEAYAAAAPGFPVKFERRLIELRYAAATVRLPVHLYSATGAYSQTPVLLLNGGVDTWKMDFHGMCVAFAQQLDVAVVAFDQPGTGENPAPLVLEADEIVLGLAEMARRLGTGKVAHFGTSFGGNYAVMTGLLGAVDASIALGAPVAEAFAKEALADLPYGMPGIIGNAMGFDRQPVANEFAAVLGRLSRNALLSRTNNAPMLVINGADDYFVPQADTRIFEGRACTETHLIAGTGHCAFSKLPEVMGIALRWLSERLIS